MWFCRSGLGTGCLPSRQLETLLENVVFIGCFLCGSTEMSRSFIVLHILLLSSPLVLSVLPSHIQLCDE